jgi:spermidine synthase
VKAAEPAKPAEPEESVHKMLSFNENTQGGITTVVETTTKKPSGTTVFHTLFSNGKFQGDDSTQGAAQAGVAVIPSLFTAKFDRALLIGLGTGHSAYALRHTGYHNVDIAEFSPGIVKAASTYFRKLNGAVLEDPQVHLAQEDGRNMLLADRSTKYDLITIELTSIWFAGATNLYSREFYELADQRLNPDGVLQQRVQFHHISPAEISSAVATARAVFPYVSLWFFGSQGMIVATHHPQTVDHARLDDLARKLSSMSAIKEAPALLADNITRAQILGTSGVERMLHELHPVINTDHNRWIEYMTPRYNSSDFNWEAYNLAQLAIYSDAGPRAEAK